MLELHAGGPVVDAGWPVPVGADDRYGEDPLGDAFLLLVQGAGEVESSAGFHFGVDSEYPEDVGALPTCSGGFGVLPSGFLEPFGDDALGGVASVLAVLRRHGFPSLFLFALLQHLAGFPHDLFGGHVEAYWSAFRAADFGAVESAVLAGESAFEDPG